jgi:hypothetical protein
MDAKTLKLKIATYGAIRPVAWTKITSTLKEAVVKPDESFIRELGCIAFIECGLLKEYDARGRKKPSIINFMESNTCFSTTKHNQAQYLKAIVTTRLFYLTFDDLISLFLKYKELKPAYDALLANYEQDIAFRQILLEEKTTIKKIQLFITKRRSILPLLKKRDMANYCHISYDNFIRVYKNLL